MADDPRRRLLHRLDNLLEGVEQLRLRGFLQVPERLQAHVAEAAAELGQTRTRRPRTVAETHDYLFRLQRLLLRAGNERQSTPAPARAARPDASIPPLDLPARANTDEAGWQEQVRLVVHRARDCASYLAAQAQAASRVPGGQDLTSRRADQVSRAQEAYERLLALASQVPGATTLEPAARLPDSGLLQGRDLVIDLDAKEVRQEGRTIPLTAHERTILAVLVANQGRVVTREGMLHLIHGDNPAVDVRSRALDVHLHSIRTKLGNPPYLETVAGVGYRAAASAGPAPAAAPELARERRRAERDAWARRRSAAPTAPPPAPGPPTDRRTGR